MKMTDYVISIAKNNIDARSILVKYLNLIFQIIET